MKTALGIFAKEPEAGRVKTRLCPPFSASEAARLYQVSLAETVGAMTGGFFSPVIFYSGGEEFFRRNFPGVPLVCQGEGSLGERMDRALFRLLGNCAAAALIGSDSPDLPPALVREAFAALETNDFVTVPSRDGGYVLVGERRHHPELFRDIPWSTDSVLATTRCRAAEKAIPYGEVGGWDDVDDLASLRRLVERTPTCTTAALGRQLLDRYGL